MLSPMHQGELQEQQAQYGESVAKAFQHFMTLSLRGGLHKPTAPKGLKNNKRITFSLTQRIKS